MIQYEIKEKLGQALRWQIDKADSFKIRLVEEKDQAIQGDENAKRLMALVESKSDFWLRHFIESMFIYGSAFFYKFRDPRLNDFALQDLFPLPTASCSILLDSAGVVRKIDCDSVQPLVQFDVPFADRGTIDASLCVFYSQYSPYENVLPIELSPAALVLKTFERKTFGQSSYVDETILRCTGVHPVFTSPEWSRQHPEVDLSLLHTSGLEFVVAPLVSKFVGMLNRHINFYGDFHFDFEYKGKEA